MILSSGFSPFFSRLIDIYFELFVVINRTNGMRAAVNRVLNSKCQIQTLFANYGRLDTKYKTVEFELESWPRINLPPHYPQNH